MLPKSKHPQFTIELPTSKKKITFIPWTMREEKILLMAKESDDIKDVIVAMLQVCRNCVSTKLDFNRLALVDIEYIFMHIRAKSVGSIQPLYFEDPTTKKGFKIDVNIDAIKVKTFPNHQKKIILDEKEGFGVIMRYPDVDTSVKIMSQELSEKLAYDVMLKCIESIFDSNTVYKLEDHTEEEILEFFDGLNHEQGSKIKEFFATMPSLYCEIRYKDSQGEDKKYILENIRDFFM